MKIDQFELLLTRRSRREMVVELKILDVTFTRTYTGGHNQVSAKLRFLTKELPYAFK